MLELKTGAPAATAALLVLFGSGQANAHLPHVAPSVGANPDPANIVRPDGSPAAPGDAEIWIYPTGEPAEVFPSAIPSLPTGAARPGTRDA
jgi:hypothetical protein